MKIVVWWGSCIYFQGNDGSPLPLRQPRGPPSRRSNRRPQVAPGKTHNQNPKAEINTQTWIDVSRRSAHIPIDIHIKRARGQPFDVKEDNTPTPSQDGGRSRDGNYFSNYIGADKPRKGYVGTDMGSTPSTTATKQPERQTSARRGRAATHQRALWMRSFFLIRVAPFVRASGSLEKNGLHESELRATR